MSYKHPLLGSSALGFGGYRIVAGHPVHRSALVDALDSGCTLIDTACNYGDGLSEELIGEVLALHPLGDQVRVVTKAGYVSPSMETRLQQAGVSADLLTTISEESKYSLSPEVLRLQIAESSKRLRRQQIDVVLLHNPEHLLERATSPEAEEWRRGIIKRAFEFLENHVAAGAIRCYGISSNVLATGGAMPFETWVEIAKSVAANHHFSLVQFPFNLLEAAASAPTPSGSLIERIRAQGLRSMGNRPLTSHRGTTPIRLASSSDGKLDDDGPFFDRCVELVQNQLSRTELPYGPMDFMVMQFLRDNRSGIGHPDLVDAIFQRHVYPFVDQLWKGDTAPSARTAFVELHTLVSRRARHALSREAEAIRKELVESGVISPDDRRSMATIACSFGLKSGLDHVVVGMRTPLYVAELKALWQ